MDFVAGYMRERQLTIGHATAAAVEELQAALAVDRAKRRLLARLSYLSEAARIAWIRWMADRHQSIENLHTVAEIEAARNQARLLSHRDALEQAAPRDNVAPGQRRRKAEPTSQVERVTTKRRLDPR